MTFDEFQKLSTETAVYPGQGGMLGLLYVALGLGDESGEVQGKVKKALRDDDGVVTEERKHAIVKECGDVLWYMSQVLVEIGVSMDEAAIGNLEKLADRRERGVLNGSGDDR